MMQGAMPLEGLPATWRTRVMVAPYATHTVELSFYFPHPGTGTHNLDWSDRTRKIVAWCCVRRCVTSYIRSAVRPSALKHCQLQALEHKTNLPA